ncbi:ATP-binding protein [Actinoplanes sp. NPDC049668]|uniref:ATP-binding protein n=1 Tax=unclassified Actinoplanes TaxID=2626549 RepID=UPI0033B93E2D
MGRGSVITLTAVASALLSVLLAVAVNVATGGTLPGSLNAVSWLAWPAVGVLAVITIGLAVWQQRLAEPEGRRADGTPQPGPPAELPAAPAVLAGRADDTAAVDRLLAAGDRVLVLVGPPGVGKSALALRIAYGRLGDYPDGQLFAALRGAGSDPVPVEAVLTRFLGALGVPEDERRGGVDDLAARLRSTLAGRRVLMLLDDARDAGQVAPLLPADPACLVLVTSRWMLADLPDAGRHQLGGLAPDDGRALLAGAIGEDRAAADPGGTAAVVESCGRLPLAIRIAGARLRARPAWTPAGLAARLADERRRLDELQVGDLAVRSSFQASHLELSPVDAHIFRRAGSHPGQVFGVGAAAALADLDEHVVAAGLERLVDAHLVESPLPDRYRLHDLLRLFAGERLAAEESPEDRNACLARLLDWLTSTARAGRWLAQERENALAAVRRGLAEGAYERTWALVGALHALPIDNPERLTLWRAGVDAAAALGDDRRRVHALCLVSSCHLNAGDVTRMLTTAEEAVALAERLGDRAALAEALHAYGEAYRDQYHFAAAEFGLSRALELFVELGDDHHELELRIALATLYNAFRRPDLAMPMAQLAVALLPAREGYSHGWALLQLSIAHKLAGHPDEAERLNTRVIAVARRIDDEYVLAYALRERGWRAHEEGHADRAVDDMRQMLAVCRRIHHGSGVGSAYEAIGAIAASDGRYDEAVAAFDSAIAQFDRLHDRVRAGQSRLHRADALAGAGRVAEARAEWATAEELIGTLSLPDAPGLRERLGERLGDQPRQQPTAEY